MYTCGSIYQRSTSIADIVFSNLYLLFAFIPFIAAAVIVVILIVKAKRPRISQMQKQYQEQTTQQQQPQNSQQPTSHQNYYGQQGYNQQYFNPQGQPYYYQNGQPYYQQPYPYVPNKKKHSSADLIAGIIIAVAAIPVLSVLFVVILVILLFRSCPHAESREDYENAIASCDIIVEDYDSPDTLSAGSCTYEKLFDSNYDLDCAIGDFLVLENLNAARTGYGPREGYKILTKRDGSLVTPENEYYTTIVKTDVLTYKGESIIVCCDMTDAFFLPTNRGFDDQVLISLEGDILNGTDIELNLADYDKTIYNIPDDENICFISGEYSLKEKGTVTYLAQGSGGNLQMNDRVKEIEQGFSETIVNKNGEIVFPKNAQTKHIEESFPGNNGTTYTISANEYSGDRYQNIWYFDIDKNIVAGEKYDADSNQWIYGLYDLDGELIYLPRNTIKSNEKYCFFYENTFFFKTDKGYELVDMSGKLYRTVEADSIITVCSGIFVCIINNSNKNEYFFTSVYTEEWIKGDFCPLDCSEDIITVDHTTVRTFYKLKK